MASPAPAAGRKQSFTIERHQIGPITHLRIRGTIDETFNARRISDTLVGHVLIDLGRVDRISSFGVRQWMELTQRLPLGAFGLYLMHAPPVLVDQLNMVEGFAGIAQVISVLAPYTCEKCAEERVRVIDIHTSEQLLAEGKVPEFECPSCSTPMQFADSAEEYFSYVNQHPVQGLDPVITRYLASLGSPRAADQANPVKIVQDDLTYFRMGGAIRKDLSVRRLASGLEGKVIYDFASVAEVDPAGVPKLVEVLKQAAAGATVVLWRLPPQVVKALAGVEGIPPQVAVANLWLPCECAGCGSSLSQAVSAADYLKATSTGGAEKRSCGVCGAPAHVPQVEGASKLLASHPATDVPYKQIEAVEPKAASQLLHFSTQPEHNTPNTPVGEGRTQASSARMQAIPDKDDAGQALHLLKHLGRGGMAEVFLARQVGLKGFEKYVTVKRVLPQFAQSQDFVEMLFAEARANARLTHPNVVQIFDVGSMGGVAHLTMEYVRGPDLKRVLVMARKAGSSLPVAVALRIIAETAAGLHYAHTFVDPLGHPHPVIHRDVSPHNVLISLDGAVKLSDFGIAKVNDGGEGTRPGTFKGKIHYSSPEQIRGLPLDARHDLFSLGIVLFESITGFLPFKGENDVATLTAIAQAGTPDPRQAIPSLPDDVVDIMQKALAKNPDERFQSAGEFREAIEEVMMRNRYRSSPVDVAHYVRDLLGERLKDFTPQGLTDPGSPRPASNPSMQALTPSPLTPSNFRRSATLEGATQGDGPRTAVVGPPSQRPSAPRGSGLTPAPGTGLTPKPTTGLTPRPSATGLTPKPSATGHTPVPTGLTPKPSATGHTPVPTGTTPRPSATGHTPVPMPPPPGSVPLVPSGPLAGTQGPVAAPLETGDAAGDRGRSPWVLVLGGLVAAVVAGAVVIFSLGGGPAVEVSSLRPGETLFISGLEVDPLTLRPQPDAPPVVVAVAVNGELKRMGTAKVGKVLDLQPLFEASGEGQTARLSVTTKQPGCKVELDGKAAASPTPLSTSIPAGKAMELKVACGDKPAWTRRLLAVPGQQIEVATDGIAEAPKAK